MVTIAERYHSERHARGAAAEAAFRASVESRGLLLIKQGHFDHFDWMTEFGTPVESKGRNGFKGGRWKYQTAWIPVDKLAAAEVHILAGRVPVMVWHSEDCREVIWAPVTLQGLRRWKRSLIKDVERNWQEDLVAHVPVDECSVGWESLMDALLVTF